MGAFSSSQPLKMKTLLAIAFLFAGAECRRHLCDDGTRPKCADGTKDVELVTNLAQPALMGLNASAQGVESTASSATRCAPIARAALLSAGRECHTAHGPPRTGTNTMESRPSTPGTIDLAISPGAITGDLHTMEIGHK